MECASVNIMSTTILSLVTIFCKSSNSCIELLGKLRTVVATDAVVIKGLAALVLYREVSKDCVILQTFLQKRRMKVPFVMLHMIYGIIKHCLGTQRILVVA